MSQDPYLEREAEKYASPIPSREFILMHLAKREKPVSREELAQELALTSDDDLEALRRRLRAMERDGQLIFTRRQCYALPERLDLIKGTVIGHLALNLLRPSMRNFMATQCDIHRHAGPHVVAQYLDNLADGLGPTRWALG